MFKRSKFVVVLVLAVFTLFVVVACAESTKKLFGTATPISEVDLIATDINESDASAPDIDNGASKFKSLGCSGCHNTDSRKLVGPGLAGVGSKGDDYVRTSIVDPAAVIVDGFNDLMPKKFGDAINGDDMGDLIAYLNTLN